jgi:hypothetical protein
MRYFVPRLSPSGQGRRNGFKEKLGGRPEGLPPSLWPACAECGGPMSLIGQFEHHGERLDLGREERRLFVFMCDNDPGTCATWEANSGANACLVVEPEQAGTEAAEAPRPAPVWNEAIIVGWTERDDGIDESLRPRFFSDSDYYGSTDRPGIDHEVAERVPMATKFGSVPLWLQSSEEGPADHDFIGQIDCQMPFEEEPDRIEPWMSAGDGSPESPLYWASGPDFGDCGIAYLFADRRLDPPVIRMFWQCL